jgi:glycosyltransferase involved in cell wall biosynthesis
VTVCLTMIVKNEEHVIEACLASVRHLIDRWVILDTGSTDGTKAAVLRALSGVPGCLESVDWEGFGKTRTKAFARAKGKADYALVLDADETIDAPNGLPSLDGQAYVIWAEPNPQVRFITRRLFRLDLEWSYIGVVHEYPAATTPWEDKVLEGVTIRTTQNGARSKDPEKYLKDAATLERALVDEPDNSRYVYYLAQCLRDGELHERAASRYLQRSAMGPGLNPEEVYCSLLEAGRCFGRLGRIAECERALVAARQEAPHRPEAMASLAELYSALARATPPSGTMNVETHHFNPPRDS